MTPGDANPRQHCARLGPPPVTADSTAAEFRDTYAAFREWVDAYGPVSPSD
jgi:hypothetical protein